MRTASASRARGVVYFLGANVPFTTAWALQQALHAHAVRAGAGVGGAGAGAGAGGAAAATLLALEHAPVVTLGRGAPADERNLRFALAAAGGGEPSAAAAGALAAAGGGVVAGRSGGGAVAGSDGVRAAPLAPLLPVHRVERGGQATYHGPGQVTVYPIVDLRAAGLRRDLHWYVRGIEDVVIRTAAVHGVVAARLPGRPGVWVHEPRAEAAGRRPWRKLGAVGMAASSWVTFHGFALNVGPSAGGGELDMAAWRAIVPCGIADADKGVTSLAAEAALGGGAAPGARPVTPAGVLDTLVREWEAAFAMDLRRVEGWPATPPAAHDERAGGASDAGGEGNYLPVSRIE